MTRAPFPSPNSYNDLAGRLPIKRHLEKAQDLLIESPSKALSVLEALPPQIERLTTLSPEARAAFLARAHGLTSTAYAATGTFQEAKRQLDVARRALAGTGQKVRERLQPEIFSLRLREAMFFLYKRDYQSAYAASSEAVNFFEHDLKKSQWRDDRSLPGALNVRGLVTMQSYRSGIEDVPPTDPLKAMACDFQHALLIATNRTPRTQLTSIHNIGVVTAISWFSEEACYVEQTSPAAILRLVKRFQTLLKRRKIRIRSVPGAKSLWLKGLAIYHLTKTIQDQAETQLIRARNILLSRGTLPDVVEITLDYIYCLLKEGQFMKASILARELEDLFSDHEDMFEPSWQGMLALFCSQVYQRQVTESALQRTFESVRGIPRIASPFTSKSSTATSSQVNYGW